MDREIRTLFIGVFVDLPKIPIFKKMFLISYEDTLKEYGHDFGQILLGFFSSFSVNNTLSHFGS